MTDYMSFLRRKERLFEGTGIEARALPEKLFAFQRDIVQWACRKGRAALFEDCGLGKTAQQLAWAEQVVSQTNRDVLILAPLAVSTQTVAEGEKFGIEVRAVRTGAEIRRGITVTNYERLHHVTGHEWGGLVLDESSCLKGFDGKFRKTVTDFARRVPYCLACTATPAPNDLLELANHADFLNVLSGKEVAAIFFNRAGNTTHRWRLKRHAVQPFYRWLASWAVALRMPSDLGYADESFALPSLIYEHVRISTRPPDGYLFAPSALGLAEMRCALRASLDARVEACAARVNSSTEPYLVWCHLNAESRALSAAIPGAIEVTGSDPIERKEAALQAFSGGHRRVLISKPSIAGWGLNWQHCGRMDFVGLSYSWELFYQAIRRCWRFGRTAPVRVGLVASENEMAIVENLERKERQATLMMRQLVEAMRDHAISADR